VNARYGVRIAPRLDELAGVEQERARTRQHRAALAAGQAAEPESVWRGWLCATAHQRDEPRGPAPGADTKRGRGRVVCA
jgi:hypothetical protein